MTRARMSVAALALAGLVACGGGSPDAADQPGERLFRFPSPVEAGSAETLELEARAFGGGRVAVVFAHAFPSSQDAWAGYASEIADKGFLAITFNFRGYGLSQGSRDPSRAPLDVAAAVDAARGRGADVVFLAGASMGGTAAIMEAVVRPVAGVVALSPPLQFMGLDGRAAATRLRLPILLVVAEGDGDAPGAARAFYDGARGPKRIEIVPDSAAHGTDLLLGRAGESVRGLITEFLLEHRG